MLSVVIIGMLIPEDRRGAVELLAALADRGVERGVERGEAVVG
jgi:hypothetical protein